MDKESPLWWTKSLLYSVYNSNISCCLEIHAKGEKKFIEMSWFNPIKDSAYIIPGRKRKGKGSVSKPTN